MAFDGKDLAELALRESIAAEAIAVADAVKGRPYLFGGKTTAGFDCSGFVAYVLGRCLPEAGLRYAAAAPFVGSASCERLRGRDEALPGDFVFFRRGGGGADHIGIVLSDREWIGSQSSTGVARVRFDNPYWSKRPAEYYRLASRVLAPSAANRMA